MKKHMMSWTHSHNREHITLYPQILILMHSTQTLVHEQHVERKTKLGR